MLGSYMKCKSQIGGIIRPLLEEWSFVADVVVVLFQVPIVKVSLSPTGNE